MRMMICGAVLALMGGAALAQEASEPVWDKVSFGMSRGEVEGLYPKSQKVKYETHQLEISDVHVMGKCDAEANIYFNDAGVVDKVMIAGNPSMGGRCSDQIMTALASKYGQPSNWDGTHGSLLARQGKIYVWTRKDGTTLRLKKYENGIMGGGGFGKASWELTYTNSGKELSL